MNQLSINKLFDGLLRDRNIARFMLFFFVLGFLILVFPTGGCEPVDEVGAASSGDDDDNDDNNDDDNDFNDNSDDDNDDEGCIDKDDDGSCEEFDCDDEDEDINPNAAEVLYNNKDDNCDGETDELTDEQMHTDNDGDGFTPAEGDCWDYGDDAEFINPMAIEDLGTDEDGDGILDGDQVDNDCDGETDEIDSDCDCPPDSEIAKGLLQAMNLCDERFVLDYEVDTSSISYQQGLDTLESMGNNGCLVVHKGCEMAVMSTGQIGQANPNNATGMGATGGTATLATDPQPEYHGSNPVTSNKYISCDRQQLRLRLKTPTNVLGFSFDFIFASAEYAEWVNMGYNDTFYAIMQYEKLNGGATTNICFDSNGNEIEVDVNFFENTDFPCDETGSGWAPTIPQVSGSTGWLRTSWDVEPGDEFNIIFSIHDEGDCLWDSIVFIDNWKWYTKPVEPGTDEIDPEPEPPVQ
jgi:hypothetical protein